MSNQTIQAEQVTLYFKEGSSDKVYAAQLEQSGKGWVVNFQYGRRGSTMNTGTKTQTPVPFEKAKSIFDKLIHEKTAKGYTPGETGTAYKNTTLEERDSGLRVQLLNDIDEIDVDCHVADMAWGMQEKIDGRRVTITKVGKDIVGANRKGLVIALPDTVINSLPKSFEGIIDGEAVGDTFYAFDLLKFNGSDIRKWAYLERYGTLNALEFGAGSAIKVVPLYVTPEGKRGHLAEIKAKRGEGVVFKRLDAPYTAGRPNAGGDQLKFKFYATGSFVVTKVNAKRSVALGLNNGRSVGNVTITPNKEVPAVGDVIEVRYLYAYKGGSLYQPTFLMVRDDITVSECSEKQLKFKADDEDEA